MPDEPNAIVDMDDLSNYVNDYVRLTSEYDALQEEIDDISTYTSVTPEEVETTVVVPSDVYDGLVIDNSQNTPVPEEDDVNLPEDPIDTVSYITEYRTVRYQLTRYDIEFLEYLHNDGATFYAILDDDNEVEIDYNDIIPPYGERLEEVVRYDDIISETIGMNFWNDTNGVHVSQVEKDDWQQAVTDNFSDSSLDKPYHNILMNSEGILLRRALLNLFGISRLAINFYDGTGNASNNITATFGSAMAQIGKTTSNHVVITSNGVTAYKGDGTLDELTAIIDGVNLKNSTITGSKIASSTIENSNIKDGTITGAKIQGSTLTNIPYAEIDQLKTRNVTADAIQAATGFVASLATNSITAAKLVADQGIIDNLETNFAHIQNGVIDNANINVANVNGLSANYAHITNGVIDNAKIGHADVNGLSANYAHIVGGVIDNAKIGHADVDGLSTNYAHIENGVINNAHINVANVDDISANYAHIQNGVIDNAKIGHADVNGLSANYAHITNGTIDNAKIGHADVTGLSANYATITNLNAASGRIDDLEADHVSTSDLAAETARINTLVANTADLNTIRANAAKVTNLTAAELEADHATVGSLDTNYAQIDMANVNNAWIQNGTIKDAAISDGMINSVSANKLTAGTIDASNITVTNLNADNITTGTINGQRIGAGSLSLDKLSEDVYTETEVDSIVSNLQTQIDGAIETWTGTAIPTLQNAPASSWTTNSVKDTHVGDVYFIVNSQSNQNGYNYRFTKSGTGNNVTYSWQLIKDSDVTNALQRLTTAEGKITTFDSDISQLKTDTGTLTTKTTSLETRMSNAEADILDKVDTTTFNEVSDTVDSHSQSITQMSNTLSTKADSSTVTSVSNRVSKTEQDISGINTKIGSLETTVENKADSSTVTTVSNNLNTLSQTVNGQAQTISSLQSTVANKADGSTVTSLTSRVNDISDTVDGHTSTLQSTTSSLTTLRTDFDNLEIGGRNLIWDSSWNDVAKHWTTWGSPTTREIVTIDSIRYMHVVTTAVQYQGYSQNFSKRDGIGEIAPGEKISISYTAYSKTDGQHACVGIHWLSSSGTIVSQVWHNKSLTTTPKRYVLVEGVTVPNNVVGFNIMIGQNVAEVQELWIGQVMVEKSTKASNWSPAPEDLEEYATTAANAVPRMSKINAPQKTFTTAQWKTYGAYGRVEPWMTGSSYNNSHLRVGDRAYITGIISDQMKGTATIIGEVTKLNPSPSGTSSVTLKSEQLIFGGDAVSAIQTSLSETQTDYATFKQTTQNFESTIGSTYATKEELTTTVEQATQQYVDVEAEPFIIDDDGINAPLRSLEANGWSEQFSTTGKNLLPNNATSQTINDVTFAVNTDGSISISGTSSSGINYTINRALSMDSGTYTLSTGTTLPSGATFAISTSDGNMSSPKQVTFTASISGLCWIYISNGVTVNTTVYPQLELGSTATAYEPYTGGAPSPSPDYPQEIKVARGRNLIDISTAYDTSTFSLSNGVLSNVKTDTMTPAAFRLQFNIGGGIYQTTAFVSLSTGSVVASAKIPSGTEKIRIKHNGARLDLDIVNVSMASLGLSDGDSITASFNVIANDPSVVGGLVVSQVQLTLGPMPQPYVPYGHVGLEVQGKNLFGGEAMKETILRKVPNATWDQSSQSAHFSAAYVTGVILYENFKPDTVYTFILSGRNVSDKSTASNLEIKYTDGTYYDLNFSTMNAFSVSVTKSNPSKSIESLIGVWATTGTNLKVYECGIFEGDLTIDDFEPYYHTTTPIPLPERGWAGSLPDGTADTLTIDGAGKVTWEESIDEKRLDTSQWNATSVNKMFMTYALANKVRKIASNGVIPSWLCSKLAIRAADFIYSNDVQGIGQVASNDGIWARDGSSTTVEDFIASIAGASILYPLATSVTEQRGYVNMPEVYPGCTISIPELDEVGISYWTPASKSLVDNTKLLEERVSNAETSIDQNKDQIALRAKSSDVYTKTQTDGLISTEVTNRNSAINQKADAITASVASTYTTKTEFNNLEIGGRNLLPGTEDLSGFVQNTTDITIADGVALIPGNGDKWVYMQTPFIPFSRVDGYDIVLSFEYKAASNTNIWIITEGTATDTPTTSRTKYRDHNMTLQQSTMWTTYSIVFNNMSLAYLSSGSGDVNYFRIAFYDRTSNSNLEFRRPMLERGNKPTDWTPAPEDLEAYTDTQVNSAKAAIKVTTDGISSEVSKISSVKYVNSATTAGWALDSIKTWATEGYSTSWNVVSTANIRVGDTVYIKNTDITRQCPVYAKVTVTNILSSTSISAISHGYEDVLPVETIKSTINQSSDSVKIQAKHVEIDGAAIFSNSNFRAAADAAYDTKGSAAAVQTNLDNLEIGGRNLLPWSSPSAENLIKISNPSDNNSFVTEDGYSCYKITGSSTSGPQYASNGKRLAVLEAETQYTYSAWVKLTTTGSNTSVGVNFTSLGHFSVVNDASTANDKTHEDVPAKRVYSPSTISIGVWTKIQFTFTTNSLAGSWFGVYPKYNNGDSYTLFIRDQKLEKGNKATDWTPAPEDVDASITSVEQGLGGFDILWNRAEFATDTNAGGECYICAYDSTTATRSDNNGWVMWNGLKRTVPKGNANPNAVVPYNIPIYIVCRLSSATSTTGTNYMVWYNSGWKYSVMSPTAVGGTWTWAETTDMVLGKFVEPGSEVAFTECETYRQPLKWGAISTDTVTARSANAIASAAAPKTQAVSEEQYVYISRPSGTTSISENTTWVSTSSDAQNTWTTKRPTYDSSYPVLFVAKQRKTVSGTVTCTQPVKDDTTTIIDGGHITTGAIDASKVTVNNIDASKITTGSLSADRIKANVIDAVNNGTGTINADKINASNLSIGYSQLSGTPTIPTKVSQLTNDSSYATTTQLSTKSDKTHPDTRSDNQPPSWYITNYPRQTIKEFKFADTIGISSSSRFCTLETTVPWNDSSGGYPTQITIVNKVKYSRVGIDASTWSPWVTDNTSVTVSCVSIDYSNSTASLKALLYIDGVATTTNVSYQWLKDGTAISGATSQTLAVTSAMGLNHIYSCTVTY